MPVKFVIKIKIEGRGGHPILREEIVQPPTPGGCVSTLLDLASSGQAALPNDQDWQIDGDRVSRRAMRLLNGDREEPMKACLDVTFNDIT